MTFVLSFFLSESAVRERRRLKRKWQEGSSVREGSTSSALSPGSSGQRRDEVTDVQLWAEKVWDVSCYYLLRLDFGVNG